MALLPNQAAMEFGPNYTNDVYNPLGENSIGGFSKADVMRIGNSLGYQGPYENGAFEQWKDQSGQRGAYDQAVANWVSNYQNNEVPQAAARSPMQMGGQGGFNMNALQSLFGGLGGLGGYGGMGGMGGYSFQPTYANNSGWGGQDALSQSLTQLNSTLSGMQGGGMGGYGWGGYGSGMGQGYGNSNALYGALGYTSPSYNTLMW